MDDIIVKEILEAIKENLKDVKEDLKEFKDTQKTMQTDVSHIKEDLNVHIYRTQLAEENIELHRTETKDRFDKVDGEIEPLKRGFNMLKGGAALIAFTLTVLTILSLLKII